MTNPNPPARPNPDDEIPAPERDKIVVIFKCEPVEGQTAGQLLDQVTRQVEVLAKQLPEALAIYVARDNTDLIELTVDGMRHKRKPHEDPSEVSNNPKPRRV